MTFSEGQRVSIGRGARNVKALVKFGHAKAGVELRDVPAPEVGPGDALIEVRAAGIRGSDIGFYDGMHEKVCRPPVVLGHEFAGVVSRIGQGVKDWTPRDSVVSDNTGYLFGVGALGLFSIRLARVAGAAEILAIGLSADAERFSVAAALGASRCIAVDSEDIVKIVRGATAGEGVGLVIDASGTRRRIETGPCAEEDCRADRGDRVRPGSCRLLPSPPCRQGRHPQRPLRL